MSRFITALVVMMLIAAPAAQALEPSSQPPMESGPPMSSNGPSDTFAPSPTDGADGTTIVSTSAAAAPAITSVPSTAAPASSDVYFSSSLIFSGVTQAALQTVATQSNIKNAIVSLSADISADDITVTGIETTDATSRRLLADNVRVSYTVRTTSSSQAAAVKTILSNKSSLASSVLISLKSADATKFAGASVVAGAYTQQTGSPADSPTTDNGSSAMASSPSALLLATGMAVLFAML